MFHNVRFMLMPLFLDFIVQTLTKRLNIIVILFRKQLVYLSSCRRKAMFHFLNTHKLQECTYIHLNNKQNTNENATHLSKKDLFLKFFQSTKEISEGHEKKKAIIVFSVTNSHS